MFSGQNGKNMGDRTATLQVRGRRDQQSIPNSFIRGSGINYRYRRLRWTFQPRQIFGTRAGTCLL